MSTKEKNYCIISHTHWDREWYLPFEQFRIKLVDMIDRLLEILSSDKEYRFHLDAQTIVLEDYLEIKPEKRPLIEGFVREGRLLVGPWYVQNDFHLTSGEATVRNLLIGRRIAEDFGKCMDIGYAADQFGLISQLPQILCGFGLDTCIFGRGYGRGERQFYWTSENGSKVLCEHMFAWYNNLQRLPSDADSALVFLTSVAERCLAKGKSNSALLMNGVDHLEAQEDLTEITTELQKRLPKGTRVFQDTMPEYMQRLKNDIETDGLVLKSYEGEMRDLGADNVLTGTLASRIYLKQMNTRVQSDIERRFEPSYALLSALGIQEYPVGYDRYLWKTLIQNHPHDSICGCSVDPVHAHMIDRFKRLEENLAMLDERADEAYMQHLDRSLIEKGDVMIMCVNRTPYAYNGILTATVDLLTEEDTGGFTLKTVKGKEVPFEIVSVSKNVRKRILSPINLPGEKRVDRYVLRIKPGRLEGMARKVLVLSPAEKKLDACENKKGARVRTMQNEYLKAVINQNGSIDLTDKVSGRTYRSLLTFEDDRDLGNAYKYCEYDKSDLVLSDNARAKVSVITETPMLSARRISLGLDTDRITGKGSIPIDIEVSLSKGSKRLDVSVTYDNQLKYHRLRVKLPTGIVSDVNYAGQPFDTVTRSKISAFENDFTHPNTGFCGIDGEGYGLAVLNEGLYEYEHMTGKDEGTLALTILKATGRVDGGYGEPDEKNVTEGWEAPECQSFGKNTVRLAVLPYSGDHTEAGVEAEVDAFLAPPYTAVQHYDCNKFLGGRPFVQSTEVQSIFYRPIERPEIVLPFEASAFKLEQSVKNALSLTAYKEAEDGRGQIIRLFNTTASEVEFSLTLGYKIKKAFVTDLAERASSEVKVTSKKKISLCAKPKEIVTIRVIPE